jgi:hypothetical protein
MRLSTTLSDVLEDLCFEIMASKPYFVTLHHDPTCDNSEMRGKQLERRSQQNPDAKR